MSKGEDSAYEKWLKSYQPFHWFVEFYGIMQNGGFDVIIGNPPYVEYPKVRDIYQIRHYQTEQSGNLYAFVLERSTDLVSVHGRLGLIVPIGIVSLSETVGARTMLVERTNRLWFSNFAIRPAKLFEGVEQRLTIWLAAVSGEQEQQIFSTKYHQWYKSERSTLFARMEYFNVTDLFVSEYIPKVSNHIAHEVVRKIIEIKEGTIAENLINQSRTKLFFHRTPGYWIRIMDFEPHFKSPTATRSVHHIRELCVKDEAMAKFIGAIVSSSLYFFWFFSIGNCRNLTLGDVKQFPVGRPSKSIIFRVGKLFDRLMKDFQKNSFINTRGETEFQEFDWGLSKPIIDQLDMVLGEHYSLSAEEIDFVANFDIKIRMGREAE
jgi:hypothetical protein